MNDSISIATSAISPTAVPAFYIMRNGDIVPLTNYMVDRDGSIYRIIDDKAYEVPQNPDHAEYMLSNIKNERLSTKTGFRSLYIQRVVMSSYRGEDWFPTAVADHINCNKQDNRLENLQWLTLADNSKKARSIPVIVTEISTGNETLCENITEASKFTGLSRTVIGKLLNGKLVVTKTGYTVRRYNSVDFITKEEVLAELNR